MLAILVPFLLRFASVTSVSINATTDSSNSTQARKCAHPGGVNGIDPSCWELLNMTSYVQDWWAQYRYQCDGEPFSSCFFSLNDQSSTDCTGVRPGACPRPLPEQFGPHDFYIAYSLYGINQVFSSLYTAIGNANELASESIGAIVALLDPPAQSHLFLNDILTALTVGIQALFPGAANSLNKVIVKMTQQQPMVGKQLFPVGTTQSQVTQWADLNNELATIVQYFQGNVSQIIPAVNNNVTWFTQFAATGAFSQNPLPDLSGESDQLLRALRTFIIARAMMANNIVLTVAADTDIAQLQANGSSTVSYDLGCANGYDADGMCGPFWFDPTTRMTYSIDNLGDMKHDYTDELHTIFGNWTTGQDLFAGAWRCAMEGGPKGSLADTIVNSDGIVTVDCLSDLNICEWNMVSLDADQEFNNCPAQQGYIVDGCSGDCGSSDGSVRGVNVPFAYAGAYLTQAPELDCVCNQ